MKHTQGKVEWSHRPIANDKDEMYATQVYTSEDGQNMHTFMVSYEKRKSFYEGRNVLITRTHREANAELIARSVQHNERMRAHAKSVAKTES